MKKKSSKLKHVEDEATSNESIDRVSLRAFERTSRIVKPGRFVVKILFLSSLIFACGFGIIRLHYPIKFLPILGMGLLIANATELVHQCLHRIATGRAMADDLLGRLLGLPSGTSYWYYKWFHLWHHRHNGTEKDKESFGYAYQLMEDPKLARRVLGFARHLSMASHYWSILTRMCLAVAGRLDDKLRRDTPEMNPRTSKRIQHDYQFMALIVAVSISLSFIFQTYILLEIWLLPLFISWGPVHALIELPEHWGCDRPCADVFANTRSIKASQFARWFTNNNCNHVGHHFDMSVPMENLPAFEGQLLDVHPFKFHERSYSSFYRRFLKLIYAGKDERIDSK